MADSILCKAPRFSYLSLLGFLVCDSCMIRQTFYTVHSAFYMPYIPLSVAGSVKMVDGEQAATHLDPRKGFVPLLDAEVATPMGDISKREAESMFSETWSMVLETALKQSQYYNTVFNNVPPLDTTFSSDDEFPQSLEQIAAMIKARAETGTERIK